MKPQINMQSKTLPGAALRLPLPLGVPQNGDRDCILWGSEPYTVQRYFFCSLAVLYGRLNRIVICIPIQSLDRRRDVLPNSYPNAQL